jgi:hypothetical protein
MHKIILFNLLIFKLLVNEVYAQDTLYFANGQKVVVKLTEIHPVEIVVKRVDVPDGPLIFVPRSNVLKVVYPNGVVENLYKQDNQSNINSLPRVLPMAYDTTLPLKTNGKVVFQKGKILSRDELDLLYLETNCKQASEVLNKTTPKSNLILKIVFGIIAVLLGVGLLIYLINFPYFGVIFLLFGIYIIIEGPFTYKKEKRKVINSSVEIYNQFRRR